LKLLKSDPGRSVSHCIALAKRGTMNPLMKTLIENPELLILATYLMTF